MSMLSNVLLSTNCEWETIYRCFFFSKPAKPFRKISYVEAGYCCRCVSCHVTRHGLNMSMETLKLFLMKLMEICAVLFWTFWTTLNNLNNTDWRFRLGSAELSRILIKTMVCSSYTLPAEDFVYLCSLCCTCWSI